MRSSQKTVAEYLKSLPDDSRKTVSVIRALIRKHVPKGYQEVMNWGMICYEVPLSRYPDTYNGQPLSYVALASQKNYVSLYLMCVYQDSDEYKKLKAAFDKAGLKMNMGKCCIRFQRPDDLPLQAIGKIIAGTSPKKFIAIYESARSSGISC
jgi:hypothetical protein